jgi:hypothetical protein
MTTFKQLYAEPVMNTEETLKVMSPTEDTIPSPKGISKRKFLLPAYITVFILGWLLFPESTAGLSLGFLFLDIGLRSPEPEQEYN